MTKRKLTHIITGLNDGGAEAVLYRLLKHDTVNQHIVVSMMDEGKYGQKIKNLGINVYSLNMARGKVNIQGVKKLYSILREYKPSVVQTWMYHADLIGGLIAKLSSKNKVIWGLHHTTLSKTDSKLSTRVVARLNSVLSYIIPEKIIACAEEAKNIHQDLGYATKKIVVISNGYDLNDFKPLDKEQQNNQSVDKHLFTFGMVGRFNPQKDHENLVKAVTLLKKSEINLQCLLVGPDVDENNHRLLNWIKNNDVQPQIKLLGVHSNIPLFMNEIDLHVLSSSFGEAFPNVLAEAMACGTPCVTTNVGDAALIVGNTGWVVPPSDSQALAEAILAAIEEKEQRPDAWQARKQAARQRIIDNFSIERMVAAYNEVWQGAGK